MISFSATYNLVIPSLSKSNLSVRSLGQQTKHVPWKLKLVPRIRIERKKPTPPHNILPAKNSLDFWKHQNNNVLCKSNARFDGNLLSKLAHEAFESLQIVSSCNCWGCNCRSEISYEFGRMQKRQTGAVVTFLSFISLSQNSYG